MLKEINGFNKFESSHVRCGLGVMINCVGVGVAEGVFLHPDFGIDKTNKTLRALHV